MFMFTCVSSIAFFDVYVYPLLCFVVFIMRRIRTTSSLKIFILSEKTKEKYAREKAVATNSRTMCVKVARVLKEQLIRAR